MGKSTCCTTRGLEFKSPALTQITRNGHNPSSGVGGNRDSVSLGLAGHQTDSVRDLS